MSVVRQLGSLRRVVGRSDIRLMTSAAKQATTSAENPLYEVPEGHVNSDLTSTVCNIGLNRRRDLTFGAAAEVKLMINGEKQRLVDILKGKNTVLFGIPEFDAATKDKHIPGYVKKAAELQKLGYNQVFCVATGDDEKSVVEQGKTAGVDGNKITMALDTNGGLTRLLGVNVEDANAPLGFRSHRYAIILENGIILRVGVEKSPNEVKASSADEMVKLIKALQK